MGAKEEQNTTTNNSHDKHPNTNNKEKNKQNQNSDGEYENKSTKKLIQENELDLMEEEYIPDDEDEEDDEDDLSFIDKIIVVLPVLKKKWKSVMAAIILSLLGFTFLILGIHYAIHSDWALCSSYFVLTFICGLPGGTLF